MKPRDYASSDNIYSWRFSRICWNRTSLEKAEFIYENAFTLLRIRLLLLFYIWERLYIQKAIYENIKQLEFKISNDKKYKMDGTWDSSSYKRICNSFSQKGKKLAICWPEISLLSAAKYLRACISSLTLPKADGNLFS